MAGIEIKSFNQILGSMVRKIVAETPLSDVNPGSVLLSLLEACASNDFENNVAILNVLELLSVDSIRNSDLDSKAADFGLTRKPAVAASGVVSIYNTNIEKQSANLYSLKPAPIAGQTVLFVTNTTGWAASGSLYIGRGTTHFEGPIPYTSIQTFATYSQINLGSALQKDHLSSDTVVNAQGQPDRLIPAGTFVKIPANNQNTEVLYSTLRDAVIPAGEDRVDNVLVVAQVAGTQGNALINTINQFDSAPFVGAAVSNTQAFTSGQDVETDVQLRNRIKSYSASLARGTSPAILNAVIGLSDPDENKRVASAILTHPIALGAPSLLYVDDGSGFQPSYAGQAVDVLLSKAHGTEEFVQLANYPLPRPQVVNTAAGPFSMADRMFLRVAVDGTEDAVEFATSDFVNISVATASEVVAALNAKSTLFKARLTNDSSNILIYPVDPDAETLQVISIRDTDDEALYANNVLNFPTKEVSYIALYQNNTRLKQRAKTATVETVNFAAWNLLTPGNLIISVDGTPAQDVSFTLADFAGFDSFSLLTLEAWVEAINAKFAGVTAVATPSQTMQLSSNKSGNNASIKILGGTYQAPMFATNTMSATGQESQFEINRQTGNIRLLTDVAEGDVISAGVTDAKGFVVSAAATSGVFNLSTDSVNRISRMVIVADATKCDRIAVNLQSGDTLTISNQGSSIMRILASTNAAFRNVQPGHYIYISTRDTWVNSNNAGLFRVVARGAHTAAGSDSWIHVRNNAVQAETVTVSDPADVAAFDTDAYPQVWHGTLVGNSASTTPTQLVDSINNNLRGVRASIFRTTSVKLTSTTETGGSIAIPVSMGRVSNVFASMLEAEINNDPLVANKVPQKDTVGFPKPAAIKSNNAYLSRATYPFVAGTLTANANEDLYPYSGTYSETLTSTSALTDANVNLSDVILFTRGDNHGLMRSIAAKPSSTSVGTQHDMPRTLMNHVTGDEIMLLQSLKLSADDNIVCIMDNDATVKTIDINASRNGKINSGSQSGSFTPTTTEFSAADSDNEAGVDFGTLNVWGTSINKTDFSDYAILMRARNWYASGGTASTTLGKFIVRAAEYGSNGDKMRFAISYPSEPNQTRKTALTETPSHSLLTYYFGSQDVRAVGLSNGTTVTVTGPYASTTANFPAGASGSGNYWDLSFSAGTFTAVDSTSDVLSVATGSGLSSWLNGTFRIQNKSGNVIRIYSRSGVAGTQTITNPASVKIFPLNGTTVSDIVSTINSSNILTAAVVGSTSLPILLSTYEDNYSYVSNATALGYGHNPGVEASQGSIALYDGINWVKKFQNANPNFTTKTPFTLTSSGVSSTVYAMHTAPNEDGTTGEKFKLVPTTVKNVQHHLTQKALSQLPILSEVGFADASKRIQIVTKQLGSAGGIQILGGQANLSQTDVIGDARVVADSSSNNHLVATVSAFPSSYSVGDVVKLQNRAGVRRKSRLLASDYINVSADGSGMVEYRFGAKTTNFTSSTTITITDVSSSYTDYAGNALSSGMVFRWTHSNAGAESLANVKVGDVVAAYGMSSSWKQGNLAKVAGDGTVAGLPIIAVNDASRYFDVVCPFGKTMTATSIGSGSVAIYPAPRIRWNLAHMAPVAVTSISRSGSTVTIVCSKEHMLSAGDSFVLSNSGTSDFVDGTYTVGATTSATTFTLTSSGNAFSVTPVGAKIINSAQPQTKYRMNSLGVNGLVRLSYASGAAPRFADAGVAVDDYIVISGSTFSSLNNGTYRVIAVDNSAVVFENPNAIDNINTVVSFNDVGLTTTWTSNSSVVTGAAGAFKNLSTGVWVKKQEDEDARYLQVVSRNGTSYADATSITLGDVYGGITGTSYGVGYDQSTGFDAGTLLKDVDDIAFYEGDSVMSDDKLFVQNISNANWFSANNSGSYTIAAVGSNTTDYRPFMRVRNSLGTSETNRSMAVNTEGFYVVESDANKYYSYRLISNSTVSESNSLRRSLYMLPDSRSYKISEANGTYITHTGKLGFDLNTTIGTDGYLFYTGLLRRVQRTVDGYGPDPVNFPERRAVGSRIETLPPLIKNLSMALTIATNSGFTTQDITNNVKSAIIDYVSSLGVGQDVILSAIIAKVMQVRGVASVTFNVPDASQERIGVASNEKAIITADNIEIN